MRVSSARLFGDHAKTGIGTRLTTGSVIGAGANVFGSEMPPKYVPPFSWADGKSITEFRLAEVSRDRGARDVAPERGDERAHAEPARRIAREEPERVDARVDAGERERGKRGARREW